jgi:hypothetical protein
MTSRLVALALAAVRGWTRTYTWRLPRELRDARRAEIESDLFESQRDGGRGLRLASQIAMRLLLGVADDLRWRISCAHPGRSAGLIVAALATTAFLMAAFWWIDLMSARRLPVPPGLEQPMAAPAVAPLPAVHQGTSQP